MNEHIDNFKIIEVYNTLSIWNDIHVSMALVLMKKSFIACEIKNVLKSYSI